MSPSRGRTGSPEEFIAKSRMLALAVLVGSVALVVLLLLLPFTMEHTLEGGALLVWASLLLVVTLIVGIALTYTYLSAAATPGAPDATEAKPPDTADREAVVLDLLPEDERAVYRRLLREGGEVLQKDLLHMVAFSGPKLSRVLDRLERKGLVVRERHGMTNRVRIQEREA